jgi:hypothetical protein
MEALRNPDRAVHALIDRDVCTAPSSVPPKKGQHPSTSAMSQDLLNG